MLSSRTLATVSLTLALAGCGASPTATLLTSAVGDTPSVSLTRDVDAPPAGAAPDVASPSVTLVKGAVVPDQLIVGVTAGHRAVLAVDSTMPAPIPRRAHLFCNCIWRKRASGITITNARATSLFPSMYVPSGPQTR